MKTTKKGFTLIELIVVIAIIGVLAAILVPTMLGYVKKSKLSSATTTASSVQKAINTALVEMDEEGSLATAFPNGVTATGEDVTYKASGGQWADDTTTFGKKVKNYFSDITKVTAAQARIKGGSCVAVAVQSGGYYGTVPTGVVTTDNYDSMTISTAYAGAVAKSNS